MSDLIMGASGAEKAAAVGEGASGGSFLDGLVGGADTLSKANSQGMGVGDLANKMGASFQPETTNSLNTFQAGGQASRKMEDPNDQTRKQVDDWQQLLAFLG